MKPVPLAKTSWIPNESVNLANRALSASTGYIEKLLDASYILHEDWHALPVPIQDDLIQCASADRVLDQLVAHGLLTDYQTARIRAGSTFGLVLGNYRVLDRLGAGGMAVVFKGEHIEMRRSVAIKVLPLAADKDPRLLARFVAEMRAVARLQHPNIVAAFDSGKACPDDPDSPILHYFVMEYVPGKNLEELIEEQGPLVPVKACDLMHQIASALVEANKWKLVHRDIKPSNIIVTPEEQAKLLDFGLVRHFSNQMTETGTLLGTVDFMAPEQTQNARAVDIRSDLYALGGTLFWCLTGQIPFSEPGTLIEILTRRMTQRPPSIRAVRPDLPAALDAVVTKLLAVNPDDRYTTPQELMRALLPFLRPESRDDLVAPAHLQSGVPEYDLPSAGHRDAKVHRILVVDDEDTMRAFCCQILQSDSVKCDEAANGAEAVELAKSGAYDLLLIDNHMPRMTGLEALQQLRAHPPGPHLKIVMISGDSSSDEMARMLMAGADDYMTKPFSMLQLTGRINAALRLKDAQDRSDVLNRHLRSMNAELEKNLEARCSDLIQARNALVLALAKLVEHRDTETGAHLTRLQRYSRCLAEQAANMPKYAGQIDQNFIELVECCAPLHDIGKIAVPDCILLKPGKLTGEERVLMQAHTTIGADTLKEVGEQHGFALTFLQTAADIARHHHERHDGAGYPDGLAGDDIPLSARIVGISDVYDALRSRRVYKPALAHSSTVQVMTDGNAGQFDPTLLKAFSQCASSFERIFKELPG